MGRLPLAALGLSPEALGWLGKLGVHKVADLQRLPPRGLTSRLGHEAARVMALLEGDDRTPLRPHVPEERPLERLVLEYGVTHHEALLFVVKRLTDRLAARLAGRVKKAHKLLLRLEVDHAVSGAPKKDPTLPITLASPLAKADELFAVVRAKILSPDGAAHIAIEHEEDGTMDVPILAVSLEVTEQVAAESVPQHLFVPEAKAERALPRLVAELSAELGPSAVGVLALVDTWVTADRSRLVPYRASPPPHVAPLVSEGEEMTRLLPVPKPVSRSELAALPDLRMVDRSEQIEWWKAGTTSGGHARDAFVAFWKEGGTAGGTAWVSVDGRTGDAFILGWID
jgi:protein ImuB